MWTENVTSLAAERCQRIELTGDGQPVTVRDFYEALATHETHRRSFSNLVTSFGYRALRWETPPLDPSSADQPFECVVLDSPGLDRPASRSAFKEHFTQSWPDDVAVFKNLSGDATLIVPCPMGSDSAYCHLASFLREAPAQQTDAMWRAVAMAVLDGLSDRRMWVNTAGGGVPWLHVRLDSRPKYYRHAAYRAMA
ncbi:hypothetical protein NG895_21245 [Aeoliella sp. ICT_H6.2]|uniref:Uncharacterized protein n=1 Tax=Aeoliella straminimaris TaxID=2954799 RepID=A0A9X2FE99_9BACT|nr:hypothetical protein [Aeoliella straminimaris]MCO6046432.1 hypothetical protein [Aeoliella straminimaris]